MASCLILGFPVLSKLISDGRTSSSLLDASNRFYTLIPHDFGMKKPPLLDNLELIKVKGLNYYFLNSLFLRGECQRNEFKCKTSLMVMALVILWCQLGPPRFKLILFFFFFFSYSFSVAYCHVGVSYYAVPLSE